MNLKSKLIKNTLIQIMNKGGSYGVGLIATSLIAHHFQSNGYGVFSTATNYINLFAIISDMGIGLIVSKELIKKTLVEQKAFIANTLTFRLLLGVLSFLLSLLFLFFTNYSNDIKFGILILSISQLTIFSIQIFTSISQVHLKTLGINLSEFVGKIFFLTFTFIIILINLNIQSTFIAVFLSNLLFAVMALLFIRRLVPITFKMDIKVWKELSILAIPIGIGSILGVVCFKIDSILLSFIRPTVEVGMYSLSYKILEVIIIIPNLFLGIIFPQLSKLFHINQMDKLFRFIDKILEISILIALPIMVILITTADKLIKLIGGDSFLNSIHVSIFNLSLTANSKIALQMLAFAVGINFVSNVFAYVLIAVNGQNEVMWRNIIATIFNIAANLILIPKITFLGAAFVTGLTELLILILTYHSIKKKINYNISIVTWPKIILSTLLMTISIFLSQQLNIIITLVVCSSIYILSLYSMSVIKKDDLLILFRKSI